MPRKRHTPVLLRTEADMHVAAQWAAYCKGWTVGARAATPEAAMQPLPEHRRVDEIRTAYQDGYKAGLDARGKAQRRAARRYGYTISILRGGK